MPKITAFKSNFDYYKLKTTVVRNALFSLVVSSSSEIIYSQKQ